MGLRTQQLKGLNGGLNATSGDLESLEGPTQSPDLLNCHALPGTVFSRLGSAPWWDTGGTGPLYWFSFFKRFDMDDDNTGGTDLNDHQDDVRVDGATIDGTGWHWPSVPGSPPARPRQNSYTFRILTPAAYALGIDPAATLHITWQRRRLALGYKIQVKDADTGSEVLSYPDCPTTGYTVPAGTFARSKSYTIKVWAIMARTVQGAPTQLVPADNTRTFNTLLTVPINLAPTGTLTTLTPTMTCDAVVKAVRYKVKIYDAAGTTLLHTSIPLLLPSYPLGGGVLTDYATKKWTFTAYADSVCTAAYGVESEKVRIYKIELDDTLADGTLETAYTGTITATGGTGPYTYAVTSGTLPAGLTLASNGAVTGTPTTAATSAFTVTATDANGDTGSRAYSVTVAEAEAPICQTGTQFLATATGLNPSWALLEIYGPVTMTVTGFVVGAPQAVAFYPQIGRVNEYGVPWEPWFDLDAYLYCREGGFEFRIEVTGGNVYFATDLVDPSLWVGTYNNVQPGVGGTVTLEPA